MNPTEFTIETFLTEPVILVRIGISTTIPVLPYFFPRRNAVGALIFAEGLRLALKLPTGAAWAIGELNQASIVLKCGSVSGETFLATVLPLLENTALKGVSVIAQWDTPARTFKEIWRGAHFQGPPALTLDTLLADMTLAQTNTGEMLAFLEASNAALEKMFGALPTPTQQSAPDPEKKSP